MVRHRVGVGVAMGVVAGVVVSLVAAVPAGAGVSSSTSLTVPTGVSVGDTGVASSFTTVNINTPPQEAESNTVTSIRLAIGCAAAASGTNVCPTPDAGVASVASPAVGAAGTACAGVSFTVSAPDAAGVVTFTPGTTIHLAPPGSIPGSDRCTVNFSWSVLKVPATDVDAAAGVQTFATVRVTVQDPTGIMVTSGPSIKITVNRAVPGLSTQSSPSVAVGGSIFDTATVTGASGVAAPTGTVTFNVYGPDNSNCVAPAASTSTNAIAMGSAQSSTFSPAQPGTYRWVATYNGDANYQVRSTTCGDSNESVVVTATVRRRPADFDGNGTTDVSVFRPSTGAWLVNGQPTVYLGLAGDNPVPCDYDGDGRTDRAVFRPSTGAWYIEGQAPVFFGVSSDIPVPGDYDGDGKCDIAVFRPSDGGWYVNGGATTFFGLNGDVPVPADYDGDGKADIAVYRPSVGAWYRDGAGTVFLGTATDIPVPGDYDGDGSADMAVFRPSSGGWYKVVGGTTFFGLSGDIPVPGDYDGDLTSDLAVFRPSVGGWYRMGATTTFFGLTGDIPLPLPDAIRFV